MKRSAYKNNYQNFFLGLQHVLAMYAGTVVVPLIVGGALHFPQEHIAYLITADLMTCGIATLLQVWRTPVTGIGLPVVLGCIFTAVIPMIQIGQDLGLGYIYGAVIVSGLFVMIIAGWFSRILSFFTPAVTGSIVMLIGLTLIKVAVTNWCGGFGSSDYGSAGNFLLGLFVIIIILCINIWGKYHIKAFSILIALIAGTIVALLGGKVDITPVNSAAAFSLVQPFYLAVPQFDVGAILLMTIVSLVCLVESTGVYMALGDICERSLTKEDIARGYRAEGLASVIGGIFNSFPYTTFSQNVSIIQLSQVRKNNVIVIAGIILITLSLLPKLAAFATIIPSAVLGGAMLVMFGMIVAAGVKILANAKLEKTSNALIVACSVGSGLGVAMAPELLKGFPPHLNIIFTNGIVTGALVAIVLNLFFEYLFKPVSDLNKVDEWSGF